MLNSRSFLFTSESVAEGHPDKLCDQVSDALLDEFLRHDSESRVAVECFVKTGFIVIGGEVTTKANIDISDVVRKTIIEAGYDNQKYGFDGNTCGVILALSKQSPDIAQGVNQTNEKEQGAGDQGLMFGYATNETENYMPLPITLAHEILKKRSELRKSNVIDYLGPDAKSQVTIEYENSKPKRVHTVVLSTQHDAHVENEQIRKDMIENVIRPVCGKWLDDRTIFHINPTGKFIIGGPVGDAGLTGRKIIVDTYGGFGRHGGGAFCVGGDSIINTEQGLSAIKEMSSIKEGTLIKTDISPTPLEQWVDNGIINTLDIETNEGYNLSGTSNQNIRVIDDKGNYVWRAFDSIKNTDYVAIQRKNRLFGTESQVDFKFSHKPGTFRKNVFIFPRELTEDYAYLMGLLIGDGRCTSRDGVQLCVCEKEMEDIVQDLFLRLFGRRGQIFGHWAYFCGVELRAYLKELGLDYLRSWQKEVPKNIFKAPKKAVAAFLRGLFDTDGTVRLTGRNNNSLDIKLSTTSSKLAHQVQQLLLNFGIISRIQEVDTKGKISYIRGRAINSQRKLYHVRVKGSLGSGIFQKEINFSLPRKKKILNSIKLEEKANFLTVPNQIDRIKKLWNKLSSREHQEDTIKIGRLLRYPGTKGTKELTYQKLTEFLDNYGNKFTGDLDFEYLRAYYIMGHYYTKVKNVKQSESHVYDFVVPGAHTFTANGFVCHNSGKDSSKVDRSAAYASRYIAKNVVASGLADVCEVQLSYAIGLAEPVSVFVHCFGTNKIPEEKIEELIRKNFPLKPADIIRELDLKKPIYKKTAVFGHFGGSEKDFTWEKLDKVELLKSAL